MSANRPRFQDASTSTTADAYDAAIKAMEAARELSLNTAIIATNNDSTKKIIKNFQAAHPNAKAFVTTVNVSFSTTHGIKGELILDGPGSPTAHKSIPLIFVPAASKQPNIKSEAASSAPALKK